jgi:hypothetical protein
MIPWKQKCSITERCNSAGETSGRSTKGVKGEWSTKETIGIVRPGV